jgi:hypothetical protein
MCETLIANAEAVEEQARLLAGPDHELMMKYANVIRAASSYIAACSPERLIAMLDVIEAADAMRKILADHTFDQAYAYDAARSKLEEL